MMQQFICGHKRHCGFWKDSLEGLTFKTTTLCPDCVRMKRNRLQSNTLVYIKGKHILVIKRASNGGSK